MSKVQGSTPGREKFFFPIFLVVLFLFCFAFFYLILCSLAGFNLFILLKHHNFVTYF